jgi:hypothetical protein
VDASGLTGEKRRTPSLQLQGGGQWQITPTDIMTLMAFHQGRLLSGEGYREPFGMMSLSLEHKFSPRLSLNIRANDVLRSMDQKTRVDTDTLRDRMDTIVNQRRVFVGFRYTFGGVTGNDAVRNALAQAGVPLDSPAAREALRVAQEQKAAEAKAAAQAQTTQPQATPAAGQDSKATPAASSQSSSQPAASTTPATATSQPQPPTQQ